FDRYEPLVQPDGVLLVNSSLVSAASHRTDLRFLPIPANDIAAEIGAVQMANVVLLGALVAVTGVVTLDTLDRVLDAHVSARHRDKLELNKQALRRGMSLVDRVAA
ncbi:MAG: 2-oxoacid:acceptor oxidoreductase family protein, partial [Chloroflexi bacterium]|nr:2-oxoacid:acceptor oxidoreductase family protein [Chloroflexota bacterium]